MVDKTFLDSAQAALKNLVQQGIRDDVGQDKAFQIRQARRCDLYYRGQQYVAQGPTGETNGLDYVLRNGQVAYPNATNGSLGRYDAVVNDMRGYGIKYVALIGQRPPNVVARPDQEGNERQEKMSRRANAELGTLRARWEAEKKQGEVALGLFKTNTTFFYVDWVADQYRNGTLKVPELVFKTVPTQGFASCPSCGTVTPSEIPIQECPACGSQFTPENFTPPGEQQVPEQIEREYARGHVELTIASIAEVTVPFYAKSMQDCPWLIYEYDEHISKLMALYPSIREQLKNSGGNFGGSVSGVGAESRWMRDQEASPTGRPFGQLKNRATYTRVWLVPDMYLMPYIQDDLRDELLRRYPTGVKVTLVNGDVVDLNEERIVNHWSYAKPQQSEYIYAEPHCTDFVHIQDLINDIHNLTVEIYERSIPWFGFDPDVFDRTSLENRAQLVCEMVAMKKGASLREGAILKAPVATPEPQMSQWIEMLRKHGAEILGITQALFGGDSGPRQTAREAAQKKNSALMALSTPWNQCRYGWTAAYTNGLKLLARYMPAQLRAESAGDESAIASANELAGLVDGSGWFLEADEAMPMTWGDRRDMIERFFDRPQAWPLLGIGNPANANVINEVFPISGWTVPGVNERNKAHSIIAKLLREQPKQVNGKIMPSMEPQVVEDDHALLAKLMMEWCQTDRGWKEFNSNPSGYANVVAFISEELAMANPQPEPPLDGDGPPPQLEAPGNEPPEPPIPPSGQIPIGQPPIPVQ